ncbi:transcriptional regulator [Vibrio sp. 10N.286.49.C2]|uniref:helix-turn-helix domain-containing protein n=1 Tax=unclassified Vibrio TaxID=2614977 RepID=UPI000C835332|nr:MULTISPECIES: helix-turn-helix domain-containing protein [unclassified Vibrio]PMH33924.1 transcriptional regulator [Vibrio sp. 10N.286.49.C2]PMH44183.1 transcriptional regulator [Vibrio sp. 10N.286.49.B1]PMH82390.1 transcriptional regulator [Vibrio sp. 10N.286.48.B7]
MDVDVVPLAPELCIRHIKDANQQAASLVNWQQEYDQLSNGGFVGQINERRLPNIHIFREDSNRALRQQCRVEGGGLWLGLSTDDKPLHINHSRQDADKILLRKGGLDFELMTPETFSIYGIVLKQEFVQALQEQLNLDGITEGELYLPKLTRQQTQQLKYYLAILLDPHQLRWSSKTHHIIIKDVLLELLSSSFENEIRSNSIPHRQIVMNRIICYLESRSYHTPVTISELCNAVHVSRRTLQYTFQACCNSSPKQFVHRTRLNQIRRMLQEPLETRTITELAYDFGFFHLGQFSHSYKLLFGESPSETRFANISGSFPEFE